AENVQHPRSPPATNNTSVQTPARAPDSDPLPGHRCEDSYDSSRLSLRIPTAATYRRKVPPVSLRVPPPRASNPATQLPCLPAESNNARKSTPANQARQGTPFETAPAAIASRARPISSARKQFLP